MRLHSIIAILYAVALPLVAAADTSAPAPAASWQIRCVARLEQARAELAPSYPRLQVTQRNGQVRLASAPDPTRWMNGMCEGDATLEIMPDRAKKRPWRTRSFTSTKNNGGLCEYITSVHADAANGKRSAYVEASDGWGGKRQAPAMTILERAADDCLALP